VLRRESSDGFFITVEAHRVVSAYWRLERARSSILLDNGKTIQGEDCDCPFLPVTGYYFIELKDSLHGYLVRQAAFESTYTRRPPALEPSPPSG